MEFDLKKSEKETAKKVAYNLIISAMMLEEFPQGKTDKRWRDGLIFGLKHAVLDCAHLLDDESFMEEVKFLMEWEKEEEKLFGKVRYKKLQEHRKKMEEKKNLKKK